VTVSRQFLQSAFIPFVDATESDDVPSEISHLIKLQPLFASVLTLLSTQAFANSMNDLENTLQSNPKPALPIISLPIKLGDKDKEALKIITNASIVPITKGIFPQYRARDLDEAKLDVRVWSPSEYKKYKTLGTQSEWLRVLLVEQTMALETAVGGENRNGQISMLRWRAAGLPANVKRLDISGDNVDSLQKAAPPAWQSILTEFRNVSGNRAEALDVTKLQKQFGQVETKKFLENYSRLESEKGRPHEVWIFGLPDGNSSENRSWINTLVALKAALNSSGYEVFALEHTPKRKFFTSLNEAQSFARTIKPQAFAQLVEEGPATLILDKNAKVVSVTGKVSKRELDPETKKRVEALRQVAKAQQALRKGTGTGPFLGATGPSEAALESGPRFQFVNYPVNWFPPQAKFEELGAGQLKVSVPPRFSICYAYREVFAIKDFDQYHYMDAQGVNAINYGMSHKEVESHLKTLDRAYGLNVISADYDSLTAKYLHLPSDLPSFAKQEKSFCPDIDEAQALNGLKADGTVNYWWD
jgi:hypothetical protein